jgi:hypothetical protein
LKGAAKAIRNPDTGQWSLESLDLPDLSPPQLLEALRDYARHHTRSANSSNVPKENANWHASALDLVTLLDHADKRSNRPISDAIHVTQAAIDNVSRRAIVAMPTSRITYRLTVPRDGVFEAWLALHPDVWAGPGDGVLFRVAIVVDNTYDEILNLDVDPINDCTERRWIPIVVNLAEFAGRAVELVININSSLPGHGDDVQNDIALIGDPRVHSK